MDLIKYSNYLDYDNYKSYYGYISPGQEFDKFTRNLAMNLKSKYSAESTEYLLCEFYGNNYDTIFSKIQTNNYQTSILTKEYNEVVKSYLKMSEFHMSLLTGIWIPTGGLKKIGYHPEIGFQLGVKRNKMNYDITLSLKFINSQNEYLAFNPESDSMEFTNHFFGGYIGLDVGRDVFSKHGHEIQVLGGIAFDGFDTFKDDDSNDKESSSVNSYNFNFGIGYRYYFTNTFYIGLRAKYNIVDYSLNNRINFTGNPITIQLSSAE